MSHDLVVFVKLGCESVHLDFFPPGLSPRFWHFTNVRLSPWAALAAAPGFLVRCFVLVLGYHLPLSSEALGRMWSHGAGLHLAAALCYFPLLGYPGQAS